MTWCECGRCKAPQASACERCLYVDGARGAEGAIIAALRSLVTATPGELSRWCGYNVNYLSRVLNRLVRAGRVALVGIEYQTMHGCGGASGTRQETLVYYELREPRSIWWGTTAWRRVQAN